MCGMPRLRRYVLKQYVARPSSRGEVVLKLPHAFSLIPVMHVNISSVLSPTLDTRMAYPHPCVTFVLGKEKVRCPYINLQMFD